MTYALLLVIFIFAIAIFIIIVSFIMAPDSNNFSGAIVGSSDLKLFYIQKQSPLKRFLKNLMYFLIFLLVLSIIILHFVAKAKK